MAHVRRILRPGHQGMPEILSRVRWVNTDSAPEAPETPADDSAPMPIRYPYFVSRVGLSGMSLPVYTDIRHGGTQWITQIRKVEGDVSVRIESLKLGFLPRLVR